MSGYISPEFLESLLWRGESETLDFKREGYKIDQATDADKAKFVKDVLAFANAWRTTDAFILIGVEDGKGTKATVVGIEENPDDAKLQQIVGGKTNRPVHFNYFGTEIEGKKVGVIQFKANQDRPVYLKKQFGELYSDKVYIRRSSSTDIASLDEVSKMNTRMSAHVPQLRTFLNCGSDTASDHLKLRVRELEIVAKYPDEPNDPFAVESMRRKLGRVAIGIPVIDHLGTSRRETANQLHEAQCSLLAPVSVKVENVGNVLLQDVQVSLVIPQIPRLEVRKRLPDPPDRLAAAALGFGRALQNISVTQEHEDWLIELSLGKIQTGRSATSECFYIGGPENHDFSVEATVSDDNLASPIETTIQVSISVLRNT